MSKTLRDVVPHEFFTQFMDVPAAKYLDREVVETIEEYDPRFPFKHKNIYIWWILEGGYAVAWNENPAVGWSFPLKKMRSEP